MARLWILLVIMMMLTLLAKWQPPHQSPPIEYPPLAQPQEQDIPVSAEPVRDEKKDDDRLARIRQEALHNLDLAEQLLE